MTLQRDTPKVPEQVEIVGYGITTYRKKLCALIDKRFKKAGPIAVKVASAPMNVFMENTSSGGQGNSDSHLWDQLERTKPQSCSEIEKQYGQLRVGKYQ